MLLPRSVPCHLLRGPFLCSISSVLLHLLVLWAVYWGIGIPSHWLLCSLNVLPLRLTGYFPALGLASSCSSSFWSLSLDNGIEGPWSGHWGAHCHWKYVFKGSKSDLCGFQYEVTCQCFVVLIPSSIFPRPRQGQTAGNRGQGEEASCSVTLH